MTNGLRRCACAPNCPERFTPYRSNHRFAIDPVTGISHRHRARRAGFRMTETEAFLIQVLFERLLAEAKP